MSVVASGIHWVSGSVLERGRQHKDINKGRPNTKRKKKSYNIEYCHTNLRNKMENDFLTDSLMLYIEKDIVSTFSLDSIVDDFEDLKERRISFS